MDLQAPDEETMVKIAVAHLNDHLDAVERPRIDATVRRYVHDWCARSRVKTFVGIIAERYARAELEGRARP